MDALTRHAALHGALFLRGHWMLLVGVLATSGAVLVAIAGDATLRPTCELLAAIGLWCWLGRAAHRMPSLAIWAGELGIPDHARRLRGAQVMLLTTCLVITVLLELRFAQDLRTLVVPLAIATIMLPMAVLPQFSLALVGALFFTNLLFPRLLTLLFEPVGATVFIGFCLVVLTRWFGAMSELHARSAMSSRSLADFGHEAAHVEELDRAQASLSSSFESAFAVEPAGQVSARKLWLGMGFDAGSSWKTTGYALLLAVASLTAMHFYRDGRNDTAVYALLCGLIAIPAFQRFNGMHGAWMRTPHEQSILLLTPRWPQGRDLKVSFVRSQWSGFYSYAAYWLALSAFAMVLGVQLRTVLMTGVALLLGIASICAFMMHYVSRRRARPTSTYAICHALSVVVGLAVLMAGWATDSPRAALIGLAFIVLPALPTLYLFWTRRLQFPVQPPPGPPS